MSSFSSQATCSRSAFHGKAHGEPPSRSDARPDDARLVPRPPPARGHEAPACAAAMRRGSSGRLAHVELCSRSGSWRRPSSPRTAATRRDRRENNREKARAALRRPSIPVASVKVVEALPAWSEYSDRRRGTRVPYARLWRFPCGSRGHASTRWYLHCRYCSNLSLPDHLLSAVTGVYTEQGGRPQTRSSYFPPPSGASLAQA